MNTNGFQFSVAKTMGGIIAITFVAQLVVTLMLAQFGYLAKSYAVFVLDAIFLSLIITPPIYFLIVYPLQRLYESSRRQPEKSAAQPQHPIHLDALTQVLNRQAVTVDLLEAIAHSERYGNPLTVAMVDIDSLQNINDKYGEDTGDEVIRVVASTLSDALRMPDRIGRYEGEEFLLILPETSTEDAHIIADRVRGKVSELSIEYGDHRCGATISVGITQYSKSDDIESILSRLDAAIAEAKSKGSNLVVTKLK